MFWQKRNELQSIISPEASRVIEWDERNKKLDGLDKQKGNMASMFEYYKALCSIKAQFGASQRFIGKNSGVEGVVYWQITGDNGTFNVYINTQPTAKPVTTVGDEMWYASANGSPCSETMIQGYSVVVTR